MMVTLFRQYGGTAGGGGQVVVQLGAQSHEFPRDLDGVGDEHARQHAHTHVQLRVSQSVSQSVSREIRT